MQIKSWQIVLMGVVAQVIIAMTNTADFHSTDMYDIGALYYAFIIIIFGIVIASLLYFKKTSNIIAFLLIACGILLLLWSKGDLVSLFKILSYKYLFFLDSIIFAGVYHFRKNIVDSVNKFFS